MHLLSLLAGPTNRDLFGFLVGGVDVTILNVTYNIADVINKFAWVRGLLAKQMAPLVAAVKGLQLPSPTYT